MFRCRGCGFPFWLGRLIRWNDNGTITLRSRPDFRVLLIEADFLTRLFGAIQDELDLPVQEMVFAAQRDAARNVIDADLSGPFSLARLGPLKRLTVRVFDRMAGWCGQCYSRTHVYRPGYFSEGVIRNPFNRELMAAVITGAFESLEGKPYRHAYRKEGDGEIIRVEPDPGRELVKEPPPTIPLKPGTRRLDRCRRCGVPLAMRDLKWMEEEGIIMDIRKGVRMAFLDFYATTVVLEELSRRLGEDFAPIVVDTQRAFFLRHIWEEFLSERRRVLPMPPQELYPLALDTLALRGQGNPVMFSLEEGAFRVEIDNPFDPYLLAGFLSALYECAEGTTPRVSWERIDGSTLSFTLEPAGHDVEERACKEV